MEIKLLKLSLKNFKGIKELVINFAGRNTNIYGKNATGKTTIFDAFKWLFFDKDSNDKKDFNIKTLDKDNNPIHFLEHEVEATLLIDNSEVIFKKVLEEKWVKKRGQEQQEFSGHETSYWIDEVPIKKKDYEEKINNIIPESLFKLITDPLFFNNQMSWKERRELLVNISGSDLTDETILDSDIKYSTLKENLQGRSIDDYKKVVSSKIKELNDEKEKIPVRIDELTNTLITEHNIDYDALEKEKGQYNQKLEQVEKEMTDVQTRANENMKKVNELTAAKNELNNLKFRLEVTNSKNYAVEIQKLNDEKTVLESKKRNNDQKIIEVEQQITNDNDKKNALYEEWDKVINSTFVGVDLDEKTFTCPTCNREYSTEKKDEIKKEFEDRFNKNKEDEKKRINTEGQALSTSIANNELILKETQEDNEKLSQKLETINAKIAEFEKQQAEEKPFDVNNDPTYKKKLDEVNKLAEIVENLSSQDITDLQNKKSDITKEIDNINQKLIERDTQEKTKLRIKELEDEEIELSQKIQELESQLYQIEDFTKTKVNLLEDLINSKFKVVKFRLFKMQINGGLDECCDTLVNGVPYSDVNNAHKILAGLDIIETLSKFHNRRAPIFIDNRESINELYDIDSQLISLVVTEDPQLRMAVL